jgi:enterochelin esterase-like enzyme
MRARGLGLLGVTLSFGLVVGCAGGSSTGASGGAGQSGAAGQGQAGFGVGPAGQAGSAVGSGGVAGSGGGATAGATGAGGAGGAMGAGGAGGVGGATGVAGAAGGASAAGTTGAAGMVMVTDPGTDGDGNFTLPAGHPADPLNNATGAPQGRIITYQMLSTQSKIYPGRMGPYTRNCWAYVPAQYVPGTPAPFIVVQDGAQLVWFGTQAPHTPNAGTGPLLPGTTNLPRVLDNLIAAKKLPKMVALFIDNGGGDDGSSERGLEYDTVSGVFATFVETEVLPRAVTEVKNQLQIDLVFTKDPQGRATLGGSSGGAGSFSMAWFHPELFSKVIAFSGTFVRQASPEDPMYPHGCWSYHDFDPYDPTAPNGVIVKEPTVKPIRVWIEAAQNDMGAGSGPTSYRDFKLASDRMAASFKLKGYHYHYDYAMGAGHWDGGVVGQTIPAALQYVWRGYPVD